MAVFLIAMCKDELDVVETWVRHHFAEGIDRLLILDNGSTDGTRDVLAKLADEFPMTIIDEPDPAYVQSERMSRLASMAWQAGALWVLPADLDEFWYASLGGSIAGALYLFPAKTGFCFGWDHIARGGEAGVREIAYRRAETQPMAKVVFRSAPDAVLNMGNHSVIRTGARARGPLAYRHFQYRTFEQMCRKVRQGAAAYEASDLHVNHGAHWRELAALDDEALEARWRELCATPGLVFDPAPIRG